MKVKLRQTKITPEQRLGVVSDYNTGFKIRDIIDRNHVSMPSIYRILKQEIAKGSEASVN